MKKLVRRKQKETEVATNKELMEKVRMLESAEEGAKEAFGVVCEENHSLKSELSRLKKSLLIANEKIYNLMLKMPLDQIELMYPGKNEKGTKKGLVNYE